MIQRSLHERRNFSRRVFTGVALAACFAGAASAQEKGVTEGKTDLLSPYGPNDRMPPPPPQPTILQPWGPRAGTPIPPSGVKRAAPAQPQHPYAPPPQQAYSPAPQPYYAPAPQPYYPPAPQPYYTQQPYYYAPAPAPQQYYYQQPYYPPQPYYQQPYYPPQPVQQPYYYAPPPPPQPYYQPPPTYYAPPPQPPAQLLDPYGAAEPAPPAYSAPEYPIYSPPHSNPVFTPQVAAGQPRPEHNRLLLKLSLGYGYRYLSLFDASLHTAAVELTIGSQGRHAGAGGRIGFEAGQTAVGAHFEAVTLGPGVEWMLGSRVRLGLAPSLSFHFLDDLQTGGTLVSVAIGAWLDLSVDLVKNRRGGALYLAGRAGYDWVMFDNGGTDSFVGRIWLGYRF